MGRLIYEKDVYAHDCIGMGAKVEMFDSKTRITGKVFNVEATCDADGIGEMSVDFYVDKVEDLANKEICPRNRNFFREYYEQFNSNNLNAKKVIYSPPATIVLWEDGTKTTVKCDPEDTFDEMKGLALCYMKKALGNTSRELNKALRKGKKHESD